MLMLLICDSETVLVSLFSSLFHEAGHIFFLLIFHQPPALICFGAFGIRIERQNGASLSYEKEAAVALGGVLANLLLTLSGVVLYLAFKSSTGLKLAFINGFIGAFNMLPVGLLDFGVFLKCMLYKRPEAGRYLKVISAVTAASVAVGCILYNIFIGINVSLIAVSVYILLITTLKE